MFASAAELVRTSVTALLGGRDEPQSWLPHLIELRPVGLGHAHTHMERLHRVLGDSPFLCTVRRHHVRGSGVSNISVRTNRELVGFAPAADAEWWHEQLQQSDAQELRAVCRLEPFQRGDGTVGYQPRCVVNVRLSHGDDVLVDPMMESLAVESLTVEARGLPEVAAEVATEVAAQAPSAPAASSADDNRETHAA